MFVTYLCFRNIATLHATQNFPIRFLSSKILFFSSRFLSSSCFETKLTYIKVSDNIKEEEQQ